MQLYEISRCDCYTTAMHKRLDSPAVTRYPVLNKVKNDHESRVRTSQMEPKMARRENDVQALEDLKAQENTA